MQCLYAQSSMVEAAKPDNIGVLEQKNKTLAHLVTIANSHG